MIENNADSELAALWARAQKGDDVAYRAALGLIVVRLRGYFRRRLAAMPDEVEDLVQETLLALHVKRGTYDPALPLANWVFAIAGHKLTDLWRRRGRREALHDPYEDVAESLAAEAAEEFPARRDLGMLLETLPAAQRTAIRLMKVEGLTATEAAQRSGVSPSALKVQVHRGLKKLAALVREDK